MSLIENERIHRENEVIKALENKLAPKINVYLRDPKRMWHPKDLLPNSTDPDFIEQVVQLREKAKKLPDGLLITLVGDSITEDATPSYLAWLNRIPALSDTSGVDQNPFAQWIRGWIAEEDRHKVALNRYLYLSGRVDMKAIEITSQRLITNGFNPGVGRSAYKAFSYVSIQEQATYLSHDNVANQASSYGDETLTRMCRRIGGDEARHGSFYATVMDHVFEEDPEGATTSLDEMIRHQIDMPAARMDDQGEMPQDARRSELFDDFAAVAQSLGIYTAEDYVNIIHKLVGRWKILDLSLSGEAAKAQDNLAKFTPEYGERLNKTLTKRLKKQSPAPKFSWIHNRTVTLSEL